MKTRIILSVLLFSLMAGKLMAQEKDATKLLYEAIYNEEVTNDLKKAEELLNRILKDCTGHRPECSRALYHLGLIAERKPGGKPENYYLRVIERYPDVGEYAGLARTRLAKLKDANTFVDPRDGHKYRWVKIGSQVWMAENLAYMPWVNPPKKQEYGIWVYDYDGEDVAEAKATENYQKYGCLYDWATAMALDPKYLEERWGGDTVEHQGICPPGWHLPTDGEWKVMEKALGMPDSLAEVLGDNRAGTVSYGGQDYNYPPIGNYLKSTHSWFIGGNGDNSSGIGVLPAGSRQDRPLYPPYRNYEFIGYSSSFWTSSEGTDTVYYSYKPANIEIINTAYHREIYSKQADIYRATWNRRGWGFSIRCVKNKGGSRLGQESGKFIQEGMGRQTSKLDKQFNFRKSIKPTLINLFPIDSAYVTPKPLPTVVFVQDSQAVYACTYFGKKLSRLDRKTLNTVWTIDLEKPMSTWRLIEAGKVVLYQISNTIVAVNKSDGIIRWRKSGEMTFAGNDDTHLYFSRKDTLFSIDLENGNEMWHHVEVGFRQMSPMYSNGLIFVPVYGVSNSRGIDQVDQKPHPVLIALDAKTGEKKWEFQALGNSWHCNIFDGLVFVRPNSVASGPYLYAVDAITGKKRWATFLNASGGSETVTIQDSTLFLLNSSYTGNSFVNALTSDGRFKWIKSIQNIFKDRNEYPVVVDNKVFFLSGKMNQGKIQLVAIESKTGSTLYTFDLQGEPTTYPVFSDGRMYIGCTDGLHVYEYPIKN